MLAWMNVETSGLDPHSDFLLEIAVIVTDDTLDTTAVGPNLVIHHSADTLRSMDDTAAAIHTRSGLLIEVAASRTTLAATGDAVAGFLRGALPHPAATPLCGRSIGFSRSFLAAHLPGVDAMLHHRNIDVSTVKELARRWAPEAVEHSPAPRIANRALPDLYETIEELRWYRDCGFVSIPAGGLRL